jgi:pyridoxamine 5'-phosphate oxidase
MTEDISTLLGSDQPIAIFKTWWAEAKEKAYKSEMNEATAMTLSTVAKTGAPSSRVVLLKGLTETGFVFYTSYSSKKASEIAANSLVALNFYWPQTFKQVKIVGSIPRPAAKFLSSTGTLAPKKAKSAKPSLTNLNPLTPGQS